jgi:hypothetical protein
MNGKYMCGINRHQVVIVDGVNGHASNDANPQI